MYIPCVIICRYLKKNLILHKGEKYEFIKDMEQSPEKKMPDSKQKESMKGNCKFGGVSCKSNLGDARAGKQCRQEEMVHASHAPNNT